MTKFNTLLGLTILNLFTISIVCSESTLNPTEKFLRRKHLLHLMQEEEEKVKGEIKKLYEAMQEQQQNLIQELAGLNSVSIGRLHNFEPIGYKDVRHELDTSETPTKFSHWLGNIIWNGHDDALATIEVKKYLDRGGSPDAQSIGSTLLIDAVKHQHIELIKLLLARGAQVNLKVFDGITIGDTTPLIQACRPYEDKRENISKINQSIVLLLEAGADHLFRDEKNKTAQDYTREIGLEEWYIYFLTKNTKRKQKLVQEVLPTSDIAKLVMEYEAGVIDTIEEVTINKKKDTESKPSFRAFNRLEKNR